MTVDSDHLRLVIVFEPMLGFLVVMVLLVLIMKGYQQWSALRSCSAKQ